MLTLYKLEGIHAGGRALIAPEGDDFQWVEDLALDESGNLGQLCAGRRAQVPRCWMGPSTLR